MSPGKEETCLAETLMKSLERHTFVTVGCTDPVAVGLAAAWAYRYLGGEPKQIHVRMDKNIYKDALAVGIPGTMKSGLDLSVALSVLCGEPEEGLRLLKGVTPEDIHKAEKFCREVPIGFSLAEEAVGIFIEASVTTDKGTSTALLKGSHDGLSKVIVNGEEAFSVQRGRLAGCSEDAGLDVFRSLDLTDLLGIIEAVDEEKFLFLTEGVRINKAAACEGEKAGSGLGLGRKYRRLMETGELSSDTANRARLAVASAADARMSGMNIPIFGCFGSGNHGITLFLATGIVAEHLGVDPGGLAKGLAVGLSIVGMIKSCTGILTPHCGCAVAAGAGAAGGISWMLGGGKDQIENAVHLIFGNLMGMLCDGAKFGCALKVATSAGCAVESARLSAEGARVPAGNGIIGESLPDTLRNIKYITEKGMSGVDEAVLDILLGTGGCCPRK